MEVSRPTKAAALKTLHLLRHAKAVEGHVDEADHARSLAPRGIADAKAVAAYLAGSELSVDRVFCSTARRTRETYDYTAPALRGASIAYRDRLYLSHTDDLLTFIRELPDGADNVMLIGHNPTFHVVASKLAKAAAPGQAKGLAALKEKFPTGALCSIQFNVADWRHVKPGTGTLAVFVRPRDLTSD